MAFIHNKTFEIVNDLPDEWQADYFEVDELIASTIRALNLKGYKTVACCSAHAYPELNEATLKPLNSSTPPEKMISGTYHIEPIENGRYYVKFTMSVRYAYIAFDRGVTLPEPPKGFRMDYGTKYQPDLMPTLSKTFSDKTSTYSFYRLRLSALQRLHEWAESLPDIKPN